MLKWKKAGLLFNLKSYNKFDWLQEYAQLPTPFELNESTLRIYFSTRPKPDINSQYVSRTGYVDVEKKNLTKIVGISNEPIIDLGSPGAFDEFGSMVSTVLRYNDLVYAYYTGWTRLSSVPYTMSIGLAISKDNGESFKKIGDGPIISASFKEPYLSSGPVVRIIDNIWYMWYLNGTRWIKHQYKYEPVYKIVCATSDDGINWIRNPVPIIESVFDDECQVSFALFKRCNEWNTVFAYRKPIDFRFDTDASYRLGFATSVDLFSWHRDDSKIVIPFSPDSWDSEMITYPHIIELDGKIVMFYCGNHFGRDGFGYAVLED